MAGGSLAVQALYISKTRRSEDFENGKIVHIRRIKRSSLNMREFRQSTSHSHRPKTAPPTIPPTFSSPSVWPAHHPLPHSYSPPEPRSQASSSTPQLALQTFYSPISIPAPSTPSQVASHSYTHVPAPSLQPQEVTYAGTVTMPIAKAGYKTLFSK